MIKMSSIILKSAVFAANKHKDQKRKNASQTPYINYPLGVADYIAKIGGIASPVVRCASILHDTVEDTGTKYEELVEIFGSKIADIVMKVTDNKSLSKVERNFKLNMLLILRTKLN